MLQRGSRAVSPQSKNIAVNNRFGNTGIKNQQGTTVIKYDTLPLDGRTEFRFFEGSSQRNFPLSNTGSDGNKLGVGSTLVVERVYLSLIQISAVTGQITNIDQLTIAVTNPNLLAAELSFTIANSDVIKQLPVLSFLPEFNKLAENAVNTSFDFDTQVIIPPLLEYIATLRIPFPITTADSFLRLTIEGSGSIIAPRTTF
jgi:hypothetical protein